MNYKLYKYIFSAISVWLSFTSTELSAEIIIIDQISFNNLTYIMIHKIYYLWLFFLWILDLYTDTILVTTNDADKYVHIPIVCVN